MPRPKTVIAILVLTQVWATVCERYGVPILWVMFGAIVLGLAMGATEVSLKKRHDRKRRT